MGKKNETRVVCYGDNRSTPYVLVSIENFEGSWLLK
jgi:hypothetical protein